MMPTDLSAEAAHERLVGICQKIEDAWNSVYSIHSVFRNILRTVSFSRFALQLVALEEEVHSIGSSILQIAGDDLRSTRLMRMHWCYVQIAVTALAEHSARADQEFGGGVRYNTRKQQETLTDYNTAIRAARRLQRRIEFASPDRSEET